MHNQYDIPMEAMVSISGQWINRNTGEVVNVRDSIMMDNSMGVSLMDGRFLDMNEFCNNYIQMSDEEVNDMSNEYQSTNMGVSGRYKDDFSMKPSRQPDNFYDVENLDDLFPPKTTPIEEHHYNHHHNHHHHDHDNCKENNNIKLIKQLFDSINPSIEADLKMYTTNFPVSELKMLTNIFGVKTSEVAQYIFENYFTIDMVMSAITKYVEKYIDGKHHNCCPKPEHKPKCEKEIKYPDILDEKFNQSPKLADVNGNIVSGHYNENGVFEYYDEDNNLNLIYKDEDGYVFFVYKNNKWYQLKNENGEIIEEELPITGSKEVEDETHAYGPDGILYEGEWVDNGDNKVFNYKNSLGYEAMIIDNKDGSFDYMYFVPDDEGGKYYQVFKNEDGTTREELVG